MNPRIAAPADWSQVLARDGITYFAGLRTRRFSHAIAFMGRFDTHPERLTPTRRLWSPLPVDQALRQLRTAGLSVTRGCRDAAEGGTRPPATGTSRYRRRRVRVVLTADEVAAIDGLGG
ncbi:MAG TPA: hypothetical protein VIT41_01665 [Microlunatus sp.]